MFDIDSISREVGTAMTAIKPSWDWLIDERL
jgi:hypothetical protein